MSEYDESTGTGDVSSVQQAFSQAQGETKMSDNVQADAGIDLGQNVFRGVAGLFVGQRNAEYAAGQATEAGADTYTLITGKKVDPASVQGYPHDTMHAAAYQATVSPSTPVTLGYWTKKSDGTKGPWSIVRTDAASMNDAISKYKKLSVDGGVYVSITQSGQVPNWQDVDLTFPTNYNFTPAGSVPLPDGLSK